MAEADDILLLRQETGATTTQVSDELAGTFIDEAATLYPSNDDAAYAYARVRTLRIVWGEATNAADYVQNEESERLSQIADAKKELLDYWEGKLAAAIALVEIPKGQRPAFFGVARASNRRWYP